MKLSTLRLITSHPLTKNAKIATIIKFLKRGIVIRLCPYPIAYPYVGQTKLLVERGMSSAELQIYTGLFDYYEMFFMLHVLKENDLFVDVGANVGVYTILASGVTQARSISLEPIPNTFNHLKNNIAINHLENKVMALNLGAGDQKGTLRFTKNLNSAINHVASVNAEEANCINVPVDTLDEILKQEQPLILKVDVEGFETKVINGAPNVLKKESLKAIIIELNGLANRYGFDEYKIHQLLLAHDFIPYLYDPQNKAFEKLEHHGAANTIYIRDIECIKTRIQQAPRITILGHEL